MTAAAVPARGTISVMNVWPQDAVTAVAAVTDPITRALRPDLEADVQDAFDRARHDYKAWWLSQHGNRIGARILRDTRGDHDTIAWIIAAAFRAFLCSGADLDEDGAEALARAAHQWHTTQEIHHHAFP